MFVIIWRMNKSEIAKQLGKIGGASTMKKYGKKHFSKAGKLGAKKRWSGHVKKTK